MHSEAEIRRQVETRLRRWGLLVLNVILWVGVLKLIYGISQGYDFSGTAAGVIALVMVGWVALVGLHALRVFYVELREYLVRRAIERARQRYLSRDDDAHEKRKHDDALPHLELGEDGELIDFQMSEDANYERRG